MPGRLVHVPQLATPNTVVSIGGRRYFVEQGGSLRRLDKEVGTKKDRRKERRLIAKIERGAA